MSGPLKKWRVAFRVAGGDGTALAEVGVEAADKDHAVVTARRVVKVQGHTTRGGVVSVRLDRGAAFDPRKSDEERVRTMAASGATASRIAWRLGRETAYVRALAALHGIALKEGGPKGGPKGGPPARPPMTEAEEKRLNRARQLAETLRRGAVPWKFLPGEGWVPDYARSIARECPAWFTADDWEVGLTDEGRETLTLKREAK